MKSHHNPSTIHPPLAAYSHQIEITGPERMLVVAGQVGMRPDGSVPDDPIEQLGVALDNVEAQPRGGRHGSRRPRPADHVCRRRMGRRRAPPADGGAARSASAVHDPALHLRARDAGVARRARRLGDARDLSDLPRPDHELDLARALREAPARARPAGARGAGRSRTRAMRAPKRCGAARESEKTDATTSSSERSWTCPGTVDAARPGEARRAHDVVLAGRRAAGQRRPSGAPRRAEERADQVVDLGARRRGPVEVVLAVGALVGGRADVDPAPARLEHRAHRRRHRSRVCIQWKDCANVATRNDPRSARQRLRRASAPSARRSRRAGSPRRSASASIPGSGSTPTAPAKSGASSSVSEPGPQPTSISLPLPSSASASRTARRELRRIRQPAARVVRGAARVQRGVPATRVRRRSHAPHVTDIDRKELRPPLLRCGRRASSGVWPGRGGGRR